MSFRSDEPVTTAPALDPLARFLELRAALEANRGWWQDKVPLRLAAACLITTAGDAKELAAATRRRDASLAARLSWLSAVPTPVRMIIAAQMVKNGDDPDRYCDEAERVREMFRAVDLRRGQVYEFLAVLVLRRVLRGAEIQREHVERFRDIYEAMKKHHWWLTGPDDFPACAMLVGRPETPEEIGAGTDAIYRALHERAGLWRGDALQTVANVLFLAGVPPLEIADRYAQILAGFRDEDVRVGQRQYDELAVLCFLPWPVERIVAVVLEFRARLREGVSWLMKTEALNLAASLAFVRLAEGHATLDALADAKLLLDMQQIVTARAAAAT